MTTAIASYTTEQIEKLATMVGGSFVTADRGAIVLGHDFCKNQSGKIQRTIEGVASETLAHFIYDGAECWHIEKLSDEVTGVLELLNEDQPCFQHAVNVIHERFWPDDLYKAAQEAGTPEQWLVYEAAKEAGIPQSWLDAFVLAKLNYQTCNGGFDQWVINGYAVLYNETRAALKRVGTKSALKAWDLLGTLETYFDENWQFKEEYDEDCYSSCFACSGAGTIDEPDPDRDDEYRTVTCDECGGSGEIEQLGKSYQPGRDQAESIDHEYYEICDQLVEDVECYVQGLPVDRVELKYPEDTSRANLRFPKVTVKLVGEDGNAMSIISKVGKALSRAGVAKVDIDTYIEEAMNGDYNNVLSTTMKWVNVE